MSVQSKYILIATGGTPSVPPIEGKELCLISDAVLDIKERPQKYVSSAVIAQPQFLL